MGCAVGDEETQLVDIEPVANPEAIVGEAPVWHAEERVLYWVDIVGQRVFRFDPEAMENQTILSGHTVTALAARHPHGVVLGTTRGLALLTDSTTLRLVIPLQLPSVVRTNDGKCDAFGRFWFGTMARDRQTPLGELLVLTPSQPPRLVVDDLILANGLGWSPDGGSFYLADSTRKQILSFDADLTECRLSNRRVLVDVGDCSGFPDGMAIDTEGRLWVAMYDDWSIRVYTPTGSLADRYELPVQKPTSLAFGGPSLRDLYVTSASRRLTRDELISQPLAGSLLRFRPDVTGAPIMPMRS